jgi:hypothetical protein
MVDVIEITKELKEKGYTLIPRIEKNLRWRATSDHIDWEWDFQTLEEVQAFCANSKEIFRQVYRRLSK